MWETEVDETWVQGLPKWHSEPKYDSEAYLGSKETNTKIYEEQ